MDFCLTPDLTLDIKLLAQKIVDEGHVEKMVDCHLSDSNWREAFLVVAGLVGSGDKLLELMETAAQKYINTDKLLTLLHWADRATAGSLANFKPVTKRVAALALALDLACSRGLDLDCDPDLIRARTLTHELAFSRGIVGILVSTRSGEREFTLARDLALTLTRTRARDLLLVRNLVHDIGIADKLATAKIFKAVNFSLLIARLKELQAKAPEENQLPKHRQEFVEIVHQTWLNALNLHQEWIDFSETEAEALANYLYANELLANCKRAAMRVSHEKWEQIERRMLLVRSA